MTTLLTPAATGEPSAATVEPSAATVEPSAATVEPSAATVEPSAATVEPLPMQPVKRLGRRLLHPVTAICAVQAALSLTLVWSNTAFTDEADYLWIGHREIAHLLHGTSWPSGSADRLLSGSPIIYPPLGALADAAGGLAAARVLSLVFMLGATVLLYLTATRLIGRGGALFATALWAFTEPTLRLAFATYDPLAIFLTALSAWLIVQAGIRRYRGELVAASAASLALAVATAYSEFVMVPVVVAFAFVVWRPRMGRQQAWFCVGWFVGGLAALFVMVMTVSRSWNGLDYTVLNRGVPDRQGLGLVVLDVWQDSALVICLAAIGVVLAVRSEGRQRAALVAVLGGASIMVLLAQLYEHTAFSLDKHLDYGIWFAAMAGGYAATKALGWRPGVSRPLAAVCCVLAFAYTAGTGWESAWATYRGWPNSRSLIAALGPVVAQTRGPIYVAEAVHIAEYRTPQGGDWRRWGPSLQLDPSEPRSQWASYYREQLKAANYSVIALIYPANAREPGLPALARVVAADPGYRLVESGPYHSAHSPGTFAIWVKVPT